MKDFDPFSERRAAVINFQQRALIFNEAILIQSQVVERVTLASSLSRAGGVGLRSKVPKGPEGC